MILNLNKSTRHALYAAMDMARAGPDAPIKVSEVAARYSIAPSALAKVFQRLVKVGIAVGLRGSGGGHVLSRPASEITLLDVINSLEPQPVPGACLIAEDEPGSPCGHALECRLQHVFNEIDEVARSTLASINLETLIAPRRPVAT